MNFSLARCAPLSLLSVAIALVVGLAPPTEAQILNGCMEDVAGFSLNCNANDIQIASVTNVVVVDDGCTAPGDTVTFDATVELLLTANARFDVGIYLATDGGDALNGSCYIDVLPTSPNPPFVNLDGDVCGDIDSSHNPIFDDVSGITVACVDTDNDGFLDLPNCLSWRQPGANDPCTSPVDAFPGSPSKCRCDTIDVTAIHVPPGEIVVTKTASPSQVNEPGGNVTFTFTVSNPALVQVTLQTLVDNIYGNLNGQGTCSVPRNIAPGGSYTCSFSVFVAGNGSQSETDVVTAAGVDVTGNAVSDTDDATVSVVDLPSAIEIIKTASPDVVLEPGGPVNFTFLVNNLSAADTVVINTLVYTIAATLLKMVGGLGLALVMNQDFKFKNLTRALLLLPFIVPTVLSTIAWQWILDPAFSVVNWVLVHSGMIDGPGPSWLGNPYLAMFSLIMVNTWRGLPFYAITLLAGLQTISPELYEAATIDGAGRFGRFRYVTLPLLKPIIFIVTMFSVIFTFADFQLIYVMTRGGPANATHVFATYAFDIAMGAGQFGQGASIALSMVPPLALLILAMAIYLRPSKS